MSTHVIGFRPPDEKWKKMKAIYDSCCAGGIQIPTAVSEFFDHRQPDESGVEIELDKSPAIKEWSAEGCEGYEITIDKLPKDVKIVRVYNAY